MKTVDKTLISLALALWCLLALWLAGPPSARAQTFNTQPGAAFVYPAQQQMEFGPVLDVVPCVLADGYTINLTLIPTLSEFAGYDNPNDVLNSQPDFKGVASAAGQAIVLVPTVLPHFRVRQVTTTVNVWDGQTVVLGGLLAEVVTSVKDKVPILGDLPWVGIFFRSESKNAVKKNLMIFVTSTLIDPAGNRLHSEDEMPFAQNAIPVQPKGMVPAQPNAPGAP